MYHNEAEGPGLPGGAGAGGAEAGRGVSLVSVEGRCDFKKMCAATIEPGPGADKPYPGAAP